MPRQIATNVFCLSYALLECSASTTVDEFSNSILIKRTASQGLDDFSINTTEESMEVGQFETCNFLSILSPHASADFMLIPTFKPMLYRL